MTPDQSADDGDRRDAKKAVEAALAAGRIVQVDRDKRIEQIDQAQTMQDIDMIVRDLGYTPHSQHVEPGQAAATAASMSVPAVNYGPAAGQSAELNQLAGQVGKAGKAIGGIIIAVVVVSFLIPIAGVAIALFASRDSLPDPFIEATDETTYLPGQEPGENGVNLHYVDGYLELQEAVREETGSTEVYQFVLYPRYAVLDIPVGGGNGRYQSYYYDGDLESQSIKSTTTNPLFDMADIDPELMIGQLEKVRAAVDDPTSWYVIVGGFADSGPTISAYASNEFSESEYISVTLDGTVVHDTTTD